MSARLKHAVNSKTVHIRISEIIKCCFIDSKESDTLQNIYNEITEIDIHPFGDFSPHLVIIE